MFYKFFIGIALTIIMENSMAPQKSGKIVKRMIWLWKVCIDFQEYVRSTRFVAPSN